MDFVVGHPRSGTQLMSELLGASGPVSEHELLPALTYEAVAVPTAFYEGRCHPTALARVLDAYRARPDRAVRIDCNWKLTWMLPPLLAAFPEARVLHLVRHPRDNVASTHALDYYGTLVDHPALQNDWRRNYWLRNMPRVRRADWDALSAFERNCAFWTESHRLILDGAGARAGYLRVRLEDLRDDAVVASVFEFLNVKMPPIDRIIAIRATRFNEKKGEKGEVASRRPDAGLTVERRAAVARLCGEMAARLGYVVD
jgi:hypothetical protein